VGRNVASPRPAVDPERREKQRRAAEGLNGLLSYNRSIDLDIVLLLLIDRGLCTP
jgi:hypothetical protein